MKKIKISRDRKAKRHRYFPSNYRLTTAFTPPRYAIRYTPRYFILWDLQLILHISLPKKPCYPLLSAHQFSPENTQTAKKCIRYRSVFTPEIARSFRITRATAVAMWQGSESVLSASPNEKTQLNLKSRVAAKLTFTENFARSLKSDPPTDNSPRKYHRRQRVRFSKCNDYYLITT